MKKITIFGMIFILLVSLAIATQTQTWTDVFTDELNFQNLSSKTCLGASESVDWTTASWDDDSVNSTSCVDQARCRTSSDDSTWGSYSDSADSGVSVALEGKYIQCQLNLTNTTASACNISGFGVVCGGYNPSYTASDSANVIVDGLVKFGVVIIAFLGIVALIYMYVLFKKKK